MSDHGLPKQFFDMLQESQWWTSRQLQNYQRSQLAQLLRHARANVPFYERRLDAVFTPGGDIDWDRWTDIPIATRQDLVERGDTTLARALPRGHEGVTTTRTSGTSGVPITLTSTQVAHVALNANRFRYYKWHDIDWTQTLCAVAGEDPQVGAWPDGQPAGPWGPDWDLDSLDGMMLRIYRGTPPEQVLEFLARKGASYMTGGPNRAYALAIIAKRIGAQVRLAAFLPHGEATTEPARTAIREAFGAHSVDLYSSKEGGHLAHLCPDGHGLHVNAESVLVEIVDDRGLPVAPGVEGRVVITPLFNAAQPLIRYEQGDFASWAPTCSCGRHLPVLTQIIGRSTALFYHPDGRPFPSFMGMHRHLLKCVTWQIAQTGPTRFEVRYVPADPDEPGDEIALAERMRQFYFDTAEVSFRRVPSISTTAAGKLREYVNEWEPVH
jgi:phenylacetate-CoA ligase